MASPHKPPPNGGPVHCDCTAEPGAIVHDQDCATHQGPPDDPSDHYDL